MLSAVPVVCVVGRQGRASVGGELVRRLVHRPDGLVNLVDLVGGDAARGR